MTAKFQRIQKWVYRIILWGCIAGLMAWALSSIPLGEIWATLSRLSPEQLFAWGAINILILALLCGRWYLLLRAHNQRVPFLALMGYRLASFAVSYFTPGPQMGGEAMQAYVIQRRHKVEPSYAISTIALDKMLEIFGNFLFVVIGGAVILTNGFFSGTFKNQLIILSVAMMIVPTTYLIAVWRGKHPLTFVLRKVPLPGWLRKRLEKVVAVMGDAESQVGAFFHEKPRVLAQALGIDALIWGGMLLDYWIGLQFLGLSFSIVETIGAMTVARIAFMVPTPGALGALELSQVLVMQALGVSPSYGISLSLMFRGRDILMGGVGLGLVSWILR